MKKKDPRALQDRNSFADDVNEPEKRLALVIEEPNYDEYPIETPMDAPLMYVCLNTLAIIDHYSHFTPVCTLDEFAVAHKSIWNATRN